MSTRRVVYILRRHPQPSSHILRKRRGPGIGERLAHGAAHFRRKLERWG